MEESLKKLKIRFSEGKQERSKRTLDNLLQAAEEIVEEADASSFDARSLARRSGYALGSLINRLGAVENVFLYAIAKARSKHVAQVFQQLSATAQNSDPEMFVRRLVEVAFELIEKVNPSVIQFYERRALLRANNIASVHCYTDEAIDPLMRLIESNQSQQFRSFGIVEAKYICRAIFLFVERPFAEGDPIAGTEEHKRIVIENVSRMLAS